MSQYANNTPVNISLDPATLIPYFRRTRHELLVGKIP